MDALLTGISIAFSFWRQSLDVVGHLLAELKTAYCRVDRFVLDDPWNRRSRFERSSNDKPRPFSRVTMESIYRESSNRPCLTLGPAKEGCIARYIVKGFIEKSSREGQSVEDRQITKIRLAQAGEMHSAGTLSEAGPALIHELDRISER
ncbi:unnamed protein product [Clonostachys rosea]|uniref:Uncharacterized protein n=1 Tax=Bionectria ochroleuca TaxID=29856 RepID=A0ABY6V081_BIOOC|nr:unnamed protein product [Clonostachys rosea]